MTLARASRKWKNADEQQKENISFQPNDGHHKVFTSAEENSLVEYIITASKLHQGLSKNMCEFAYEYAKALNRKYPASWERNQTAGEFTYYLQHLKKYYVQCFMKYIYLFQILLT